MARKKKTKRVLIIILIIIVLIFAGTSGYIASKLGTMKKVEISNTVEDLEISEEAQEVAEEYNVTNFAFFGIDSRDKDYKGLSDAIMIATIDKDNDKIKLSSIMRDTYVDVTGHGMTKITHAYSYGGAQLALATINKNFDLDIKNFVTVDFFDLQNIIDELGGVTIEVDSSEIKYINGYIDEVANISNITAQHITTTGLQTLNGSQAVAYCRIRYTAGGDFARSSRQREVLEQLLNKFATMDKTKFVSVASNLLQYVQTNMDAGDILKIGTDVLRSGFTNIEQTRFPVDGVAYDLKIDGVYYLGADLEKTTEQMHAYIYDDVSPGENKY
ncbi:LCP family protein [Clostridium sp. DL1XJH146]